VGNFQDVATQWQPRLTVWWKRRKDEAVAGSATTP
jgi:hypothetical protein